MVLMMGIVEDDMNTADHCPRGRELKGEWQQWANRVGNMPWLSPSKYELVQAWQDYRTHVDTCDQCNSYRDNTNK